MSTFAESALNEFEIAISEATSSLNFVNKALWLRPRLNDILDQSLVKGDIRINVEGYLDQKNFDPSSIYRGILITICGATEQALRKLTEQSINQINRDSESFDGIPPSLQNQNIYRSGRALATIVRPLDHLTFNYSKVALNLASCSPGSKAFFLNADAFSHCVVNATSSQIVEIYHWLGKEINWDDIAKDSQLKQYFNIGGTREISKSIKQKLDSLVTLRNRVAHTGIGGATITDTEILDYCSFLRLFIPLLAADLSKKITKKKK